MTTHYPMRPILKALEPLANLPRVTEREVNPSIKRISGYADVKDYDFDEPNITASFSVNFYEGRFDVKVTSAALRSEYGTMPFSVLALDALEEMIRRLMESDGSFHAAVESQIKECE